MKCIVCFNRHIANKNLSFELVQEALSLAADAATIKDQEALCDEHLWERTVHAAIKELENIR